jgi:hypothetical protein
MRTSVFVAVVLLVAGAAGCLSAAPLSRKGAGQADILTVFLSDRSARQLGVGPGALLEISPHVDGPWTTVRIARVYRPVLYPSDLSRR